MFWAVYFIGALIVSLAIAKLSKRYYLEVLVLLLIIFLTPAQIDNGANNFAPSIFIFFFNIALEGNYSLRPLRPLALTLPSISMVLFLIRKVRIKRAQ